MFKAGFGFRWMCFVPLLCSKLCKSQRVGLCVEWRAWFSANITCGGIIDRKKMQKDSVSTQTLTSATPLSCEECPSGFE